MKVLSPANFNVKEADSVHKLEGSKSEFDVMARMSFLFRGLSPRYEIKSEAIGTWEILLFSRDENGELQTIRKGKNVVISSRKSD